MATRAECMMEIMNEENSPPKKQVKSCDEMIAQSCAELGLTLDDLKTGDIAAMSKIVDMFHMKVEVEKLDGDFDTKLIEVAKAWHGLDNGTADELLEQAQIDPSTSLIQLLRVYGIISKAQADTLTFGKSLVESGKLDFRQMSVAYRDECDGACTFQEALDLRHWLKD